MADTLQAPAEISKPRRLPSARILIVQGLIILVIAGLGWFLVDTTLANLRARGITTGFAFLNTPLAQPINHSWLEFTPGVHTYGRALVIGFLNTLTVSTVVIVLATILGTAIGLSRLSRNWLLARTAGVYVEVIRNVPVLVQLIFWYQLLLQLPPPRGAIGITGGIFISNRGIRVPTMTADGWVWIALAGGIVAAVSARRLLPAREILGERGLWLFRIALVLLPPLCLAWLTGSTFTLEWPHLQGLNFRGGAALTPELSALVIGLTVYTAAFIAEIVRAGIQGVPPGQWDAARSLGLRSTAIVRKVIMPQALRIIVPPLASEYLGVTKNSSLAVAVGYPDLVAMVNIAISDTGQAIEGIVIVVLAFLTISLAVSAFMNWYNARIALVTR
jgi:general L-amino acid transport system permease protein